MTNKKNDKPIEQQIKSVERAIDQENQKQEMDALEAYEKSGYTQNRDIAANILGQSQIYQAYAKFSEAASLAQLMYIKENKLYRHMAGFKYVDSNGENRQMPPTWEGYLNAIGLKRRTVDEQILDCKTVGQEAYDAMNRIGIGTRAFKKLRQLPEEDRSIIVNEVEANLEDKDSILGLIDDLSEKHVKEKETLQKEITDLKQKNETNERLFADKDKKINDLDRKLDRLRNKVDDWHPRTFEISMETTKAGCTALEGIDKLNILRDTILNEDFGEEDRDKAIEAMAIVYYDAVSQIMEQAAWLMKHCNGVFEGYKLDAKPLIDLDYIYVNAPEREQ